MTFSTKALGILARLRPVGTLEASAVDVACRVIDRIAHRKTGAFGGDAAIVFVARRSIYAVRDHSVLVDGLTADQIIGRYTFTARTDDIAADIAAWKQSAPRSLPA